MKTDEQVMEEAWVNLKKTKEWHEDDSRLSSSFSPSDMRTAINFGVRAARANPPRVEGFPESDFNKLVAMLPPVVRAHCEVAARWMYERMRHTPQPAPFTKKGEQ